MAPRQLPDEDLQRIGSTIQATRELRGLSRPQLAKMMGTTTTNIHRMEQGNRGGYSLAMMFKLAAALQCSWREILGPEPGSDGGHSSDWEAGRRAGIGEGYAALGKLMRTPEDS